ncbi:hypothetical protein TTHERM_00463380 (macronuclear) [Tetrahymena thermophila SB210]|uniref:Uncharacterized protein n=1 Tax=Tetrahymena thermophila (strain SB210) TaxID=312017 RepID=Q23PU5_TETTS|nr:hypothetical protein TTHERM_00463380 [Tetrahymena thermophila SB210]EAR98590.2 hypothetical protein TTHERM_00463380 [Tetrahymena thermophila SB210]|eukprot:XP_001018835.2 hypothetical protein TTHERM_00463380 [Tetrahymena thermophila SB210]
MSLVQRTIQAYEKDENKNFEEFIEKSLKAFREEGMKFEQQKECNSQQMSDNQRNEWEEKIASLESLFKMFCVLKGQKRKKSRVMYNICEHIYGKNLLKRTFWCWKSHQKNEEYLRQMEEQADVFYNRRTLTKIMRSWQDVVIDENKTIVKNTALKKTELELQKNQKEFENQIKSLEILLQQKILTLRHEEQQYNILFQKQQLLSQNQKIEFD